MSEVEPAVFAGPIAIYKKPIACLEDQVIFLPLGKCASSSVRQSLRAPWAYVTKDWIPLTYAHWERVAVIRDPLERLASAFRFFKANPGRTCHLPTTSWAEFVEAAYYSPDDATDCHVRTQAALLSHAGEFLPTILVPFEELEKVKDHLPIDALKHAPHTKSDRRIQTAWTPELRRMAQKRYRADLRLRDTLTS